MLDLCCKMCDDEVAALVVDNHSGMCQAGVMFCFDRSDVKTKIYSAYDTM